MAVLVTKFKCVCGGVASLRVSKTKNTVSMTVKKCDKCGTEYGIKQLSKLEQIKE